MKSLDKVSYRRITVGIVVALLGLTPIEVFGQRIRKEYRTLSTAEETDFVAACKVLKDRAYTGSITSVDPSWDDFVVQHHSAFGSYPAHSGPSFLA